jgi:hypothetical protein
MLKTLCDYLHIPCFALMDADPHGINIFLQYKFGRMVVYCFLLFIIFSLCRWAHMKVKDWQFQVSIGWECCVVRLTSLLCYLSAYFVHIF